MSRKDYLKNILMSYFIIVTLINIAMFVLGMIFERNRSFGYEAFVFPLIYGLLGILPSFLFYSKKMLATTQMLLRKVFRFLCLEFIILTFFYMNGIKKIDIIISMAVTIAIIDILSEMFSFLIDSRKAIIMTRELKEYQNRH